MKLFWSSRSPFVRKVMVVVHETGLQDRIETVRVVVGAGTTNPEVMRHNPLNKIPSLVLPDGSTLFDSLVICEYLDTLRGGPALFPVGTGRWAALRWHALGNGMMDLILLRLGENNRAEAIRSAPHQAAFAVKLDAALDVLEAEADGLAAADFSIGGIAIGCALSHLDFRFAGDAWREGRPRLAAWHDGFRTRPSVLATEFSDEY